ncbi:hypothetical protein GGQ97_000861 [Sphingomonas kaistensis]|uniref:Uncharacterized protein n=1 Tax=Sphingomonas kaistensis TaxID=298708 RepID=A0A7X5Y4J3_9SPHN|nr:hypothetical protein [Sphingomonas kaistensis]NJC05068.1 hypothetical protein [Sphingomonas kaistensis]
MSNEPAGTSTRWAEWAVLALGVATLLLILTVLASLFQLAPAMLEGGSTGDFLAAATMWGLAATVLMGAASNPSARRGLGPGATRALAAILFLLGAAILTVDLLT